MLPKSYSRKVFPRIQSKLALQSTQADSHFYLPALPSKLGSLDNFISNNEFRKGISSNQEDNYFHSDPKNKKPVHRLYLTMNEELTSNSKKEVNNTLVGGQEDRIDSIDERNKLLYDEHVINRQKAALNICKAIVDDVKKQFGYVEKVEETEKAAEESFSSDSSHLSTRKLVKLVKPYPEFSEKLDKILVLVQHKSSENLNSMKRNKKMTHELVPGDIEDTKSHDSSFPRLSRIKEKPVKEENLMASGILKELFTIKPNYQLKILSIPQFPNIDPEILIPTLEKLLESPAKPKPIKYKKSFVSINKQCISLPECKFDSRIIFLICNQFNCYRDLLKIDFSGNFIGDTLIGHFITILSTASPNLEHLDLSNTGSELQACEALFKYLSSNTIKLQTLRLEKNELGDEGICSISVGLLNNFSVKFVNFAETNFDIAGGLAIAKVIRINRTLKGISLNGNNINGRALREISRAMIVNSEIISLNLSACKIQDDEMKELSHMLNSNSKLMQLDVSNNKITQKGLEYFKYGLGKNKSLIHLAISGNFSLKLNFLDKKLKKSLEKLVIVDICKEEDFFKTNEAKKYKFIEYIR